jgi:hypothetical protein
MMSAHNNLTTAMSVTIACGFFRNDDLLDVKAVLLVDIQPNGDGFTNTSIEVTKGVPDLVRCRTNSVAVKGR